MDEEVESSSSMFTSKTLAQSYNESMFWGTYRPNLYFGMKTRSSKPFLTGIMWQGLEDLNQEHNAYVSTSNWFGSAAREMRHSCEEGNRFQKYGWIEHDGVGYGNQELFDTANNLLLKTQFVKQTAAEQGTNGLIN